MRKRKVKNLVVGNDLFTIINIPSLTKEQILWLINSAFAYNAKGEEPREIPAGLEVAWPVIKAEQDRISAAATARSAASRAAISKRWQEGGKE